MQPFSLEVHPIANFREPAAHQQLFALMLGHGVKVVFIIRLKFEKNLVVHQSCRDIRVALWVLVWELLTQLFFCPSCVDVTRNHHIISSLTWKLWFWITFFIKIAFDKLKNKMITVWVQSNPHCWRKLSLRTQTRSDDVELVKAGPVELVKISPWKFCPEPRIGVFVIFHISELWFGSTREYNCFIFIFYSCFTNPLTFIWSRLILQKWHVHLNSFRPKVRFEFRRSSPEECWEVVWIVDILEIVGQNSPRLT